MLIAVLVVLGLSVALVLWFIYPRTPSAQPFSDEQINAMSEEEWREHAAKNFRGTSTSVLRIYSLQYERLLERIKADEEEVRGMSERSKWRALESQKLVWKELNRRGADLG